MVTSVAYDTPYDYEIKEWEEANLLSTSWMRSKLISVDPSIVRFKPGKLTEDDLEGAMSKVKAFLGSITRGRECNKKK